MGTFLENWASEKIEKQKKEIARLTEQRDDLLALLTKWLPKASVHGYAEEQEYLAALDRMKAVNSRIPSIKPQYDHSGKQAEVKGDNKTGPI